MATSASLAKDPFTTGVSEDISRFLNAVEDAFTANCSLGIEHFTNLWAKHKLTYMLLGRRSFRELFELVEHIFFVIRKQIDDNQGNKARKAAAIYLLYVFYFKQPVRPKVKIEVTSFQLKRLLEFMDECREERHLELLYCWASLVTDNAFHYSATDKFYGIEVSLASRGVNHKGTTDSSTTTTSSTLSANPLMANPELSERLERLKELSLLNQGLKTALEMQENFAIDNLNKDLTTLEAYRISNKGELINEEGEPRRLEDGDLGRRRRRLRERAFAEVATEIRPSTSRSATNQPENVSATTSNSFVETDLSEPSSSIDEVAIVVEEVSDT